MNLVLSPKKGNVMMHPIDTLNELLKRYEQLKVDYEQVLVSQVITLDDLASYTVLCSDLKAENEKLKQEIKELETEVENWKCKTTSIRKK